MKTGGKQQVIVQHVHIRAGRPGARRRQHRRGIGSKGEGEVEKRWMNPLRRCGDAERPDPGWCYVKRALLRCQNTGEHAMRRSRYVERAVSSPRRAEYRPQNAAGARAKPPRSMEARFLLQGDAGDSHGRQAEAQGSSCGDPPVSRADRPLTTRRFSCLRDQS
jgi:hypothetical protein